MAKKKVNSNQKGKRGERQARDFLRSLGFENARRTQQYSGSEGTSDVTCEDLLEFIHIESKLWGEYSLAKLRDACFQAAHDCTPGHKWVVIWRCTDDVKSKKPYRMTFMIGKNMYTCHNPLVCKHQLLKWNDDVKRTKT